MNCMWRTKHKIVNLFLLSLSLAACSGNDLSPAVSSTNTNAAPNDVTLTSVFSNLAFDSPIFLTAVPESNRLAVIEQPGRIKVFENNESTSNTQTVLDMTKEVLFRGEQGLLGMAFDPAFNRNRYVYLNYSMSNPRRTVVSRMEWDVATDAILPTSNKIILEINQPYSNHNGGMLAFGPDGYLYIGVGDGGSGGDPKGHGQDRTTLLGTLLRIDVHPTNNNTAYDIPADNPFSNDSCCRPEIYSYGWRNPYRFSFDRNTGELWVPDVGQNAIEEINKVERGGNYGWNAFEGTQPYAKALSATVTNHVQPVYEYDHSHGSSITGGYVYRGNAVPSLQGKYLYADFVSGRVWVLDLNSDDGNTNSLIGTLSNPASFGEDADGEVYVVSYNGGLFKFTENP